MNDLWYSTNSREQYTALKLCAAFRPWTGGNYFKALHVHTSTVHMDMQEMRILQRNRPTFSKQ